MSNHANGGRGRKDNDIGSWILTLIMLYAFFPAGVVMLIIKLREAFSDGKQQRASGQPMRQAQPRDQDRQQEQWQPIQPLERNTVEPIRRQRVGPVEPMSIKARRVGQDAQEQKKQAKKKRSKAQAKALRVWPFRTAGTVLLVSGLLSILEPLEWLFVLGFDAYDLWRVLQGLAVAAGGAALWGVAASRKRRAARYANYLAVIGDSEALSLDFIASATGRRYSAVVEDLQDMIRLEYFGPESYLDLAERCYVSCHAAAPRRDVRAEEEEPEISRASAAGSYPEEEQIRRINRSIADPHVTACLDRLEQLTHKILAYVEQHPEKESRIRRFRAHYLPKTIKICESYARFEQQGVKGENIRSAMQEVEDVMESLVKGFENQLDMLFDDEALDVTTDVSVLESMMAPAELKIENFLPQQEKEKVQ